ncbi:MAG: purine-binding chemotaxis protein CheW [Desulfobacteraceae bacterium]|nr:purine-binding chemotaxis protein CheW [Desulfobacteraceae bacterium]
MTRAPNDKDTIDISQKKGEKYLSFILGMEEYGIGIRKIKEIIGMMAITSVPRTPDYIAGIINLRGKVIPVVNLRLRFGMDVEEYNEKTCIIVVEIVNGDTIIQIGVLVDAVSEVLKIKEDEIENAPAFGSELNTGYILGMAKMEGGVKILLDIDKVLGNEDKNQIENLGASS